MIAAAALLPAIAGLLLTACATGGGGSTPAAAPTAAAPAPVSVLEPAPPPASEPLLAGPAAQAQAQKLALGAVDLLEQGHEEQARGELQKALALDGHNKLANNLARQITADPQAVLGRESFAYVVRPNDTLSRIAGRFMGDIYAFYILARYNDIKVPRQVAGGQQLRIPGKAPPPGALEAREPPPKSPAGPPVAAGGKPATAASAPASAAPPEPTPGERAMSSAAALERAGLLDRALDDYQRAAGLDQPGAAAKVADVRSRLVSRHTLAARTAFAKQDLAGALHGWDRVLTLDPANELAKLERQKTAALKQKADALK